MATHWKTTSAAALALGGAGVLAWSTLRRSARFDLARKVVLITGGSRGLGFQLAREFGGRGATVVICSRDEAELARAQDDLTSRGIVAQGIPCDVSDQRQVENLIQQTVHAAGTIDVLVNNAGIIQVGPLSQMTIADFDNAMNVMFWGTLYPTLAALPILREHRDARIVNITSIGGKISVPHLLPYCCAKFATVALSEGLRSELESCGIKVTTVVPGLMRTGSHLHASFKGDQAKEYAWFSLSAATPLAAISAERAARSIVRAAIRGDAEKILSVPADVAARLHGIAPEITAAISSFVSRLLPRGGGTDGRANTGAEARGKLNSRLINAANVFGERAAKALNQVA
ncbi:MAG TPA: SDR family NAD(P)-dependent oxidoreductase [Bryobacteraceae bacterium]|nr:SDR family NAD(P)-dependent oxidoreductase [Bryobacteraceae bacterium]